MRILQLHNQHVASGGASAVVERERALLSSAGHEVECLLVHSESVVDQGLIRQGGSVLWNHRVAAELRQRIRDFQPDVAHVHTPFPFMSLSVLDILERSCVPVAMTHHAYRAVCVRGTLERDGENCELCIGSPTRLPAVRHRCFRDSAAMSGLLAVSSSVDRMRGSLRKKVALHLVLTEFGASVLQRDGLDPNRIVVHPNFVPDPGPAGPSGQRAGYLFAGRLVPEKGVVTLLDAWEKLGASAPRLLIAGTGPLEDLVRDRVGDLNGELLGLVDEERVQSLMKSVRAVVFPSEWKEGIGLSWIEALAASTPVIYSDVGNFSDVLDTVECGFKFGTGNAPDLAAKVLGMESMESDRWEALSVNARELFASEFSENAALERLEAVYKRIQLHNEF